MSNSENGGEIDKFVEEVRTEARKFAEAVSAGDGKAALRAFSNMVASAATADTVSVYSENEQIKAINAKLLENIRGRYFTMMASLLK